MQALQLRLGYCVLRKFAPMETSKIFANLTPSHQSPGLKDADT